MAAVSMTYPVGTVPLTAFFSFVVSGHVLIATASMFCQGPLDRTCWLMLSRSALPCMLACEMLLTHLRALIDCGGVASGGWGSRGTSA